ncbi:DUF262 domain-containing protein [Providencia stuartii]|uniref:DUF262 domain-containing protein n=1 Tax=Providencia stuartii TaxID=588 RepID=UPI0023AF231E|nr:MULTISPECIES: DUF262 domain-containing HNH endonuclease family protein [Providencia]MDE8745847.1 DUF262 domain-containing HNH endonuclease family protein [Providencia thailandensis]MDE8767257.1 DUF262 domain-containing HNH endonuclease family protein [Providencia thailandensis]MDE8779636.1 DUF262 domain-containing HNH endonuclease family protein [Providencia thailandensis]MDE8783692.1 DUF262 domain-containing HNH endonuclease family protein [Providencia thailandensis]MDE8787721.1 DUF262 dom
MIESEKLYVGEVFGKWFRIPEYQRPYVWGKDQIAELLQDLSDAMNRDENAQYFLGSMVLQKKTSEKNNTKYVEYDVLDGQQRLTTLFLLISVIRDLTENEDCLKTCKEIIFQKKNLFTNTPERLRVVFDIRQEVKDFIDDHVKEEKSTLNVTSSLIQSYGKDTDLSIINMSKNIVQIREYFQEHQNFDQFAIFLINKVLMIYVGSEELDDAFRLFTVMNNRGVKLRSSDILKASNLALVPADERIKAAKNWEEAENYFGEDFDEFLSHLRSILVKKKATVSLLKEYEDNIYAPKEYDRSNKITKNLPPLLNKGIDTFNFVDKYRKHYIEIFDNHHYELSKSFELNNLLIMMKAGFESDFWIAPLLKYYDKFGNHELIDFVKSLDNAFAYDWLVGLTPTSRIENVNHWMEAIDTKTSKEVIKLLREHIDQKELALELDKKIYGRRAAKYLMLKLDCILHGHTTKLDFPSTISIEHILPQTPKVDSQWLQDFTEEERDYAKDRLGNLVLLSRRKNSSQNNRDYADKKQKYFQGNIELFSNSIRIFQQYATWTVTDFSKNHAYVKTKLLEHFSS